MIKTKGQLTKSNAQEYLKSSPELLIINRDGSLAKNCGNGLRVAAAFWRNQLAEADPYLNDRIEGLSFLVGEREFSIQFLKTPKNSSAHNLSLLLVQMPPAKVNQDVHWFSAAKNKVGSLNLNIKITDVGCCVIENPHLVLFLDSASDISHCQTIGSALEKSVVPEGINVHLCYLQATDEKLKRSFTSQLSNLSEEMFLARSWERGVGLTQACGSGACAIVASASELALIQCEEWVAVESPGGVLFVRSPDKDGEGIILGGPAAKIFSGHLDF